MSRQSRFRTCRLSPGSVLRTTGVNRTLAEVEADHIRNVLASAGGNKTQAAEILGIDCKTLRKRIAQYGLE